ncbi:hypothetical protein VTI28DRAFT_3169 [Corynascus sepedonium]
MAKNGQQDNDSGNKVSEVDILHSMLRDRDYDTIKEYAKLGGDMLQQNGQGDKTILHYLVEEGYMELLEHFGDKVTEFEAQEWVQKDEGSPGTLLGMACERNTPSLHLVQLLVEKLGVDVNAVYNRQGCLPKLRGGTALHILASGTHFWQIRTLEYLLSKGANIEAKNKDGMTPLLVAINRESPRGFWSEEMVRVLLRHGANANATFEPTKNGAKETGHSALEMSNHPVITKLLLEHGANVEHCRGILTNAIPHEGTWELSSCCWKPE